MLARSMVPSYCLGMGFFFFGSVFISSPNLPNRFLRFIVISYFLTKIIILLVGILSFISPNIYSKLISSLYRYHHLLLVVDRELHPVEVPLHRHPVVRHLAPIRPTERRKPTATPRRTRYRPNEVLSLRLRCHYLQICEPESRSSRISQIVSGSNSNFRVVLIIFEKPDLHVFNGGD